MSRHKYRRNVAGPQINTLRTMLERPYVELATTGDQIAENIRTLVVPGPGSYSEFNRQTSIEEARAT
jgi:DNA-binding ferritin-like protein